MGQEALAQRGSSTRAAVQLLPPGPLPGSGKQHATLYWLGHSVDDGQHARNGDTVTPQSTSLRSRHDPFRRIAQPEASSSSASDKNDIVQSMSRRKRACWVCMRVRACVCSVAYVGLPAFVYNSGDGRTKK